MALAESEEQNQIERLPTGPQSETTQDGDPSPLCIQIRAILEEHFCKTAQLLEERCAQYVGEVKASFVADLVLFADRIGTCAHDSGAAFEALKSECREILARVGVAPLARPAEGENFDPSVHKVVGTEPAGSPELNSKISSVLRGGFQDESGRIIRPHEVIVYRYEKERACDEE